MTSTIATAAATAEKVVETIARVEGPILTGVSIFVPGAAAITVPLAVGGASGTVVVPHQSWPWGTSGKTKVASPLESAVAVAR